MSELMQGAFWHGEESQLWEEVAGPFVNIVMHGAEGGYDLLPAEIQVLVDWDMVNSRVIQLAREYRYDWIRRISDTTKRDIQQLVGDWLQSGDPLDVLSGMLEQLPDFSKVRAEMVATTEVTRLYAMGNKLAWQSAGTIREFEWRTAEDELVCTECKGHNTNKYPLEEMDTMLPAHPRCRCWGVPIVDVGLFEQLLEERLRTYG